MANRTTIVSKALSTYAESDVGSGFRAAKYSIAPLWFALFEEPDLRILEHREKESGETFRIPYLAADLPRCRSTFERRVSRLRDRLSAVAQEAIVTLRGDIQGLTREFVIMDTWELWMMDVEGFDQFLLDSVRAVDQGDLDRLLKLNGVRDVTKADQLVGFEWMK